jgi:hypothetical protein
MTFHAVKRSDLPAASSPIRLADGHGREVEWANRFLDAQCVRGLQSLSSYAMPCCISCAGGAAGQE